MTRNDTVFKLVQSLSPEEVRFIKDLAKIKRKLPVKALALMDDLRNQEKFQPLLLKAKYKGFEVTKFQLKELVLRALRFLEADFTIKQEINTHLENERILYSRGINKQAEKELNYAKKLAQKHQESGKLLEILKIEQQRIIERSTKGLYEQVRKKSIQINEILAQYNDEFFHLLNYQLLFTQYRTEERIENVPSDEKVLNMNAISEKKMEASFYGAFFQLMAESFLARKKGDLRGTKEATEKALRLFDKYPETKKSQKERYKILLSNYAVYLFPEKNLKKIKELIEEIRSIKDNTFSERAETFQNIAHLELLLMLNTLDLSRLDFLDSFIENGLVEYESKINAARQLTIWYNLMLVYFISEKFTKARHWLDQIVLHKRLHVRKEIQYITRLIELIVYFELELWDLPDSKIVASERYFSRNEQLTPFKKSVLKHISKLSKAPAMERRPIFKDLAGKLEEMLQNSSQFEPTGIRVVLSWAKSRELGITLIEALKLE